MIILFPYLLYIVLTCPCNVGPLTPNVYIVKLRFTRVYIFLIFALKHSLWVLVNEAVLTSTHNLCVRAKIRKISNFSSKNYHFYSLEKNAAYCIGMFT